MDKVIINSYEMMCPKCDEDVGLDISRVEEGCDIICNKCKFHGDMIDFDVETRLK